MLRRVLSLKDSVTAAIRTKGRTKVDGLVEEEWTLIPFIIDRLEVFEEATELLSSDDYCVTHVNVLIKSIEDDINKPLPGNYPEPIKKLQTLLKAQFQQYLAEYLDPESLSTVAAALHPVHKVLTYLDADKLKRLWNKVTELAKTANSKGFCKIPDGLHKRSREVDVSTYSRIKSSLNAQEQVTYMVPLVLTLRVM